MEAGSATGSEIEWQLDAPDLRPVRRWIEDAADGTIQGVTISAAHTENHVDTYLDTADRRLDRAGYSVRLRRVRGRAAEATLKSLDDAAVDGLRSRLELAEEIDVEEPTAIAGAPGAVGRRVRALIGSRKLVPLFDVQTRRRIFPLATAGTPSGELLLDETAIREPDGGILGRLHRVEVEIPPDAVDSVTPLVRMLQTACGLQPAVLTKYEAALAASRLLRMQPEDLGPTAIEPSDAIGQVGLAVLRRHFAALLVSEPGTRLGDDIEELHNMRVASRRLRAAIALFRDFLPADAERLRPELAWLGQTIGAVRDLDVQLERLAGEAALASLRALLEDERARARADMLQALDSRRYAQLVRRFTAMLRSRSGSRTDAALTIAPDLVERRHRALGKAMKRTGPDADAATYHRARIAGKRYRYALEFLSDVYPGETKRLIRRATALQDLLGTYQDAHVAIMRLESIAREHGGALGPDVVFAMGELAGRYAASMGDARAQVGGAYARLEGRAWKRFHKRMEAARPRSSELDEVSASRASRT
jgi:triphosphatase